MDIAVIPDDAMMIRSIIKNHGHTPLSSTNFSEENLSSHEDSQFDYDAPPFNMKGHTVIKGNKYVSCEVPSGVRGRISLYDNIIENSQAAILLGEKPIGFHEMYNELNNMMLFGEVECANTIKYVRHALRQKQIPILSLAFPLTQKEIINMIEQIVTFLDTLESNNNEISIDLENRKDKISLDEIELIIGDINGKI